jgi:hypothetical protein
MAVRPLSTGVDLAPSWRRAATFSPIDPVWVFLGPCPFAAKALVYGGWKSLDFLGFSRPKRAFSIGYAGFSLKENFSRPPCPREVAATGACGRGHAEGRDCSRDKRN